MSGSAGDVDGVELPNSVRSPKRLSFGWRVAADMIDLSSSTACFVAFSPCVVGKKVMLIVVNVSLTLVELMVLFCALWASKTSQSNCQGQGHCADEWSSE